jgi:enamine deaminase RidA (YjgF/YER057c/UK114 family)
MTLELLQPEGLPRPESYSQVVVGTGTQTVYVAGQVAVDAAGLVIAPGSLAGQAVQAYENVGRALGVAGATPADVTKITTYVVDYSPVMLPDIAVARRALFGDHRPASTLVGVAALARPELLIEVEAIAVVE